MEIRTSIESTRDFALDVFHAGRLALASVIEKIDTKICDAINSPEDNQ